MWNWFNCYLSGRHEFGVSCEPGAIFLRCAHCGRRSSGWAVGANTHQLAVPSANRARTNQPAPAQNRARPFGGVAAS